MEHSAQQKKWENWWHYNWGKVLAAAISIGLVVHLIWSVRTNTQYDLQVLLIDKQGYPDEVLTALSEALSPYTEDLNGDGACTVGVVQYIVNFDATDPDVDPRRQSAAVSGMMADFKGCYSQVILCDDPDGLSLSTGALRYRDGTLPDYEVYPLWQETSYRWADCPVLAGLSLGSYDAYLYGGSGDAQTELARLYIGSRGFWDGTHTEHPQADEALWQALTEGAK